MIKKLIIATLLALSLLGIAAVPAFAQDAKTSVCDGIGAAAGGGSCTAPVGTPSIDHTIATVVNLLSVIVAIIAVIMIMIGGIKYVTSSGDSNNVNSAKNTILYAIVGLVVVALAQVIVRFVLHLVTK